MSVNSAGHCDTCGLVVPIGAHHICGGVVLSGFSFPPPPLKVLCNYCEQEFDARWDHKCRGLSPGDVRRMIQEELRARVRAIRERKNCTLVEVTLVELLAELEQPR